MARMGAMVLLIVLLAVTVYGLPGRRIRRGYNNGGYGDGSGGGYGRGSDERDASVSEEGSGGGCSGGGYQGRGYSGSRELSYNRDGRPSGETRGGRSFTKASAVASASSFSQNLKANVV